MWAQQWESIFPIVKPYDLEDTDITDELVEQVGEIPLYYVSTIS